MFFCLVLLWLQSSPAATELARRGLELSQQGDPKAAEAEFRRAIALVPPDASSLAALGIVLEKQDKLEEADSYLERALKIDPTDLNTRYNLAINQFRLKQLLQSKANLERIPKTKPGTRPAVLLLGTVLERVDRASRH
jgi:Flp pilus assembly protein TadD